MADHAKPVLTSTYTNFVTELDARFDDLAVGLDPAVTTATNLRINSIRWNSASNKYQKYNGADWVDLSASYNININGTVGATTASSGAFTTLTTSDTVTLNGGTASGIVYLNGSKVLSTGTALQFDGQRIGFNVTPNDWATYYGVIDADALFIGSRLFTANMCNVYLSPTGNKAVGTGFCSSLELSSGSGALIFRTDPTSRTAGQIPNLQNAFVVNKNSVVSAIGVYTNTVTSARSVSVNSSGELGYVSSIRASKTNIEAIEDVQWLMELDPVKFNYRKRDDEQNYIDEFDEEVEYGLIAEDAEQVNADIVFHDIVEEQKQLRGVHYNKLIVPLLKLVQQQQSIIEDMKIRLEAAGI